MHSFKIIKDKTTVVFGIFANNSARVPGGISIETDIGIFRPEDMNIWEEAKIRHCSTYKKLTIRQLANIAEKAIKQYKELLGG